jgi:serine/threonine protein kinase
MSEPTEKGPPAEDKVAGFSSSSSEGLPLPRVFGRLLLLKLLARGGMGDVYLAATTGIEGAERACVVKTVRRDHIHDGSFLARFLDEARVQAQLNHPGVAQVLEASTDENGEPFTVVEYVEGRSLADVRQRAIALGARVNWPEAVAVAIEIAQALAHVHERAGADATPLGIVHRDLSPQNVMIGYAGDVKLIDFGTARAHNRKCHTVAGVVFAKPGYVAPEVARQQVGDGRIDVYALGIMLWEMCKGSRFLTGDAQKHLEDAAAGKVIVPKIASAVDAPPGLDDAIQKLTANDPDERYPSAALAALDLARLLAKAPSSKAGERGVRARISMLVRTLWPHEPARSRAEFARLLKEARGLVGEVQTPSSAKAAELAAMHSDDPSVLQGTPYRVLHKIGEGASGVVYEAEHVELGRKVALKVLGAAHASARDAIDRFRREARAVAKLSHPNLVALYDFGKSIDGRVFLAMELLSGETLDRRIKRLGGMDWREAVLLGVEVCRALEAAHGAGLVHRDLKPANLFLTEGGGLKLLDFGVAMALADVVSEANEKRQKGFAIFGTPEYMAPEQVAGEAVDGRCDLYALGCVLYELVTGSALFDGPSSVVVMGRQLREEPEPLQKRAPMRGIPEELDAVVLRALAKAPGERFASPTALREALEETLRAPAKRRAKARKVTTAIMLGAFLLAGTSGAATWAASHRPSRDARVAAKEADPVLPLPTPPPASEPAVAPVDVASATAAQVATPELSAPAAALPTTGPAEAPPPTTTPTGPSPVTALAPMTSEGPRQARLPDPVEQELRRAERALTRSAPSEHAPAPHPDRAHALIEARAAAKEEMSDSRVLRTWTLAAFRAGELREARRAAEAWGLKDSGPEPRIVLAEVLEASGKRGDARTLLEQVLELHPDSMEAKRLRAHFGAPLPPLETVSRKSVAHR